MKTNKTEFATWRKKWAGKIHKHLNESLLSVFWKCSSWTATGNVIIGNEWWLKLTLWKQDPVLILHTVCFVGDNSAQICECVYLGVSQPQASHVANAVGFGVDGAEFLFDGAEISHQSIEIHILSLIQRLCTHRDIRMWDVEKRETQSDHNRAGEECVSFKINQITRE